VQLECADDARQAEEKSVNLGLNGTAKICQPAIATVSSASDIIDPGMLGCNTLPNLLKNVGIGLLTTWLKSRF
jgi:hypothetical protein